MNAPKGSKGTRPAILPAGPVPERSNVSACESKDESASDCLHGPVRKIPLGCARVLRLMNGGHTLHSSCLGAWTMNPIDSRCSNLNSHTMRALVTRKMVKRSTGNEWIIFSANVPDEVSLPTSGEEAA